MRLRMPPRDFYHKGNWPRVLIVLTVSANAAAWCMFGLHRGAAERSKKDQQAYMTIREIEFSYKDMPVGVFQEEAFPTAPGHYRYMPYRGGGHYEMQKALHAGSRPRCTFRTLDRVVSFAVVDCPEPHVLELVEFRDEDGA